MLEREAAFAQVQRERDALQEMLRSRGHNPSVALESVSGDGGSAMDGTSEQLTNELDVRRLQNDVKRKQAHIAVLEHEQAELMKRFVFAATKACCCSFSFTILCSLPTSDHLCGVKMCFGRVIRCFYKCRCFSMKPSHGN